MDQAKKDAAEVLIGALRLAKERVTGDELSAKLARQQEIGTVIERIKLGPPTPQPTAAEIRKLLGREDSLEIRDALAAWGG